MILFVSKAWVNKDKDSWMSLKYIMALCTLQHTSIHMVVFTRNQIEESRLKWGGTT